MTVNPTVSNAKPAVTFIFELQGITATQLANSTVKTKIISNFAILIKVKPAQVQLIVLSSRRILSDTSSVSVQINVVGINSTQSASITQLIKSSPLSALEAIFTSAGLPVTSLSWTVVSQETVRPTIQTGNTKGSTTAATTAPISFPASNIKIETDKRPFISGISYNGGIAVVVIIPILFFLVVAVNVFLYWRKRRVEDSKVTYERELAMSPEMGKPTPQQILPWPSHVSEQKFEGISPEPAYTKQQAAKVAPYPPSNQDQNIAESTHPGYARRVVPHPQIPQRSEDSFRPESRADSRIGVGGRKTRLSWLKFGDRNV